MRYLSRLFQPIITIPKNAKIKNTEITCKSQKLFLECGLIRPTSSGLFNILPLARRALDKLELQIRSCIEAAGGQRMSLPSLTSASLWEKTGRLQDIGPELIKMEDRHGKKYLLAPTHEEAIADLLADVGPLSYKQLPLLLYQISNKYRDEHRPKHGLLRSREFSMLDAYGVHPSEECARRLYRTVTQAYTELFRRLQLPVHRVAAPVGDMGGSVSHEWQLPAAAGEDTLSVCTRCEHATLDSSDTCATCGADTERRDSIEVGHTFILGTKYSAPLSALYTTASGAPQPLVMSCYGIGITRLLAASLEALSSEKSLRWPAAIAPYTVIIIGPKEGSKEWQAHGMEEINALYESISETHCDDVIIDDRHHLTIGKRLMQADRMGYPHIVVIGRASLETPARYEVYHSHNSVQLLTREQLLELLASKHTPAQDNNEGSKEWQAHGMEEINALYESISETHCDDVIIDDRHHLTIGKRLMQADRMGYPHIVVIGRASLETPARYEVYHSHNSVQLLTREQLLELLASKHTPAQDNNVLINSNA